MLSVSVCSRASTRAHTVTEMDVWKKHTVCVSPWLHAHSCVSTGRSACAPRCALEAQHASTHGNRNGCLEETHTVVFAQAREPMLPGGQDNVCRLMNIRTFCGEVRTPCFARSSAMARALCRFSQASKISFRNGVNALGRLLIASPVSGREEKPLMANNCSGL